MITHQKTSLFSEIPIDAPVVDREQLAAVLAHFLRDVSLEQLVSMLTNPYNEMIEYADLCEGESACQKTSLLFNPHRLDTACNNGAPSIFQSLTSESFCSGLARATLFKKGKVSELLYQVLQLNINAVYYCGEFPPANARDLCKRYGLHTESSVLDPCAGWGGRMIGCSVVVDNYTAYEPSTRTFQGLEKLAAFLHGFRPSFQSNVQNIPFEDSEELAEHYDLAITSPPYFDTERYADENTQSAKRFPSYSAWESGFYIPMIHKTMRQLKPDGIFVLNIGSRKYPLNAGLKRLSEQYQIKSIGNLLSGIGGLGKEGEGEMFYEVRKRP